ncbi:MAG: hypothetical protein LQ343_000246 [Gyalolechia ehrenbergii]|nr:MAG: hypothetical protein LQ343_000246 [Gyalolechia ehrenbergii]
MMSYAPHERNGELSMQEQTAAAVQNALDTLHSRKRKRDMSELGTGGPQPGPKRGSTSSMNGASHDNNNYLDNFHSSTGSNDFSNLSQQLQAATNPNHSIPTSNASSTAAAALAGIMPQMTIPQPTDMSFASTASNTDADRHFDSPFDMSGDSGHGHNGQGPPYNLQPFPGNTAAQVQAARESSNGGGLGPKPSVGSDEWHKRRRRETINEGINELAKIVPGCEKNKGSILQRAVEYITQLKANEERVIAKYTQDKMLMEGVVNELTTSVDSLKNELDRSTRNAAMLKKIAVEAGLEGKVANGVAESEASGEGD